MPIPCTAGTGTSLGDPIVSSSTSSNLELVVGFEEGLCIHQISDVWQGLEQ
jgi:hypothetical protein